MSRESKGQSAAAQTGRQWLNIDTGEENSQMIPAPTHQEARGGRVNLPDHTRTCVSSQLLHHFLCLQVPDVDHVVLRPRHDPLQEKTTSFTLDHSTSTAS